MTINKYKTLAACHSALMNNPVDTDRFICACQIINRIALLLDSIEYFEDKEREKVEEYKGKLANQFMELFNLIHAS